ncbi:MAG: exodeoxyribonuclease VII large subunit, partial [bacterium]
MNQIYTVTEITEKIKITLETFFSNIAIKGEVSNFKISPSNHLYFLLKDEKNNVLPCVFFKFNIKNSFIPKDGDQVIAHGNISTYNEKGIYQLKIESIENIGKGSFQIAFEQLKKKLLEEGLFDEKYKKNLPFLPHKIGIITSPSGAVIHDMLTLLKKRFENASIILYPVKVQGKESTQEIIQAINDFNKLKNVEVIILARGGGSLEDLQSFNEENVARTIFNSKIPIISAIGHETDYTIADFVADKRSPTPSAAIEIIIPNKTEIMKKINSYLSRSYSFLNYKIKEEKKYFKNLIQRKILKNPIDVFIHPKLQKLDFLIENLSYVINKKISNNIIYYQNLKNK